MTDAQDVRRRDGQRRGRRRSVDCGPSVPLLAALEALSPGSFEGAPSSLIEQMARHPRFAGALAAQTILLASGESPAETATSNASAPSSPGLRRALDLTVALPSAVPGVVAAEVPTTRVAEAPAGYAVPRLGLDALAAAGGLTREAALSAAGLAEEEARVLRAACLAEEEGDGAVHDSEGIERLAQVLGVPRIRVVAALIADGSAGER